MPSKTRWYDDHKTIIIHEIVGEWRIDDFLSEMREAAEELDTHHYQPKYFIVDLTHAIGIPSGILMRRDSYIEIIADDSVTIVVGAHPAIKVFVNTLSRIGLAGQNYIVDDLEVAEKLIRVHRQDSSRA